MSKNLVTLLGSVIITLSLLGCSNESENKEIDAPKSSENIEVFEKKVNKNYDIYLKRDGKVTRLTTHPELDRTPSLSPDKSKVAFYSSRKDMKKHITIYVMNTDGSDLTELYTVKWTHICDRIKWLDNNTLIIRKTGSKLVSQGKGYAPIIQSEIIECKYDIRTKRIIGRVEEEN